MSWSAETINKAEQGDQAVVELRFAHTDGRTFTRQVPTDTPATSTPGYVGRVLAALTARDAELAALPIGPVVAVPPAPPPTTAHTTFNQRLRKLQTLHSIKPIADGQLVTAMATLQGQVEAYIKANPDAI